MLMIITTITNRSLTVYVHEPQVSFDCIDGYGSLSAVLLL